MNTHTMKSIIATQYGSPEVLTVQARHIPKPLPNEVLIKIHASPVTAADGMMRKGAPWIGRLFTGLLRPKYPTPGTGVAGEVIAVGTDVQRFVVGDQVFGEITTGLGTHAEFVCIAENGVLTNKPNHLSYEEVAPVCDGALTSLSLLKDFAKIQSGQKVLINGASGSLGTSAVQIAKYFGTEVTGVCSTANLELVRGLGADHVIDYTQTDFTENGEQYDIIFDTVGYASFPKCKGSLTKRGIFLSPILRFPSLVHMLWTSLFGKKKVMFSATGARPVPALRKLLEELVHMLKQGKLETIIDRLYTLDEIVEAHRYVDSGRKKGNVVISMNA